MAKKRQRAVALLLAVVFLISSMGVTGLVLYEMYQQSKNDSKAADASTNPTTPEQTSKGKKMDDLKPLSNISKLTSEDLKKGNGDVVKTGDTVVVHYTGAIANTGKIFQSSHDLGQPIPLVIQKGQVIQGWVEGIPGMKVGGMRRLFIPAKLAYGDQSPSPDIPANSDLVFDVEIVSIQ